MRALKKAVPYFLWGFTCLIGITLSPGNSQALQPNFNDFTVTLLPAAKEGVAIFGLHSKFQVFLTFPYETALRVEGDKLSVRIPPNHAYPFKRTTLTEFQTREIVIKATNLYQKGFPIYYNGKKIRDFPAAIIDTRPPAPPANVKVLQRTPKNFKLTLTCPDQDVGAFVVEQKTDTGWQEILRHKVFASAGESRELDIPVPPQGTFWVYALDQAANKSLPNRFVLNKADGRVKSWSRQTHTADGEYITVYGVSAPHQDRYSACSAAEGLALANLLEYHKDLKIHIKRHKTIKDGGTQGETLEIGWKGVLQGPKRRCDGAYPVYNPETGSCVHCLKMKYADLMQPDVR